MSHQTALVFPNAISYNTRAQPKNNATGASRSLRSISAQSSQKSSSSSQASRHNNYNNALNQYDNKIINSLHGSNNLLFNSRKPPHNPQLPNLQENIRPKSFSLSKTVYQGQPTPPATATAEVVSESIIYPSLYFAKNAETVPFSKCCNSPAYVELSGNGSGKIICNGSTCHSKLLTEFTINFDEEQQQQDQQQKSNYLGKENLVFPRKSENQPFVRRSVSKWITTGFFKHKSISRQLRKQLSTAPCQINKETPGVGPQTNTDWNADLPENEEYIDKNYNKKQAQTSFDNSSHNPPHFYSTSYNIGHNEIKPKMRSITRDNQDYLNNQINPNQTILEKRLNWRDVNCMNKQIVEQLVNKSVIFNKPFNFDSHTDGQYPQKVLDLNINENQLFKEVPDNQQSDNSQNNVDKQKRHSNSFTSSSHQHHHHHHHHPMKPQQSQQLRQQKQNILAIKNMVQNLLQNKPEGQDITQFPFSNQALQRF